MSAANRATRPFWRSATSAVAAGHTATIRFTCCSAAAASPAGRVTGAATGCGSKRTFVKPRCNITNDSHPSHGRTVRMGQNITLTAADGFKLGAYRADPTTSPKGAIVVIQEIFGVNSHIRNICDRVANEGYVAIAPAIFDRIEPNFQSGYSP